MAVPEGDAPGADARGVENLLQCRLPISVAGIASPRPCRSLEADVLVATDPLEGAQQHRTLRRWKGVPGHHGEQVPTGLLLAPPAVSGAGGLQVGHVGQEQSAVGPVGPHRQAVEFHQDAGQPPVPAQVGGAGAHHRGRPDLDDPAGGGDGDQAGAGSVQILGAQVLDVAVRAGCPHHAVLRRGHRAVGSLISDARHEALVHPRAVGDITDDGLGQLGDPGVHLLDGLGVKPCAGEVREWDPPQLGLGQPLGHQDARALLLHQRKDQPPGTGPQHVSKVRREAAIGEPGREHVHRASDDEPQRIRVREPDGTVAAAGEPVPAVQRQRHERVCRRRVQRSVAGRAHCTSISRR